MHVAVNLLLFTIALLILLSKAIILKFDTGGVNCQCYMVNLTIWKFDLLSWHESLILGGFICLSYMCIVQDLERKLIWCAQCALVFPHIFLLVDRFKWPLIGVIEKCRVDSVLWQLWPGGPSAFGIYMFSMWTGISLYFLISWPFQMGTHWCHWKA